MDKVCTCCKDNIVNLNLTEKQRVETWGLLKNDFRLFAIEKVKTELQLDEIQANFVEKHISKKIGTCANCQSDLPDEENIECKNCLSFNYNITFASSFTDLFCSTLEFALDFDSLKNDEVKGYWCDGIYQIPYNPSDLLKSNIKTNRSITTRARIGKGGQEEYRMKIEFGNCALLNYLNDKDIIDCIPIEKNYKEWISIDPGSKKVYVLLK